jgi:UDP-N-acetylglucosamine 2-epimerase (non-hydrolysing)
MWVRQKIRSEGEKYEELSCINFRKKILLVTGHRRENFGQDFINTCEALKAIATRYGDTEIVYPVHLNPNVRKPVYNILSGIKNIKLIEPLGYEPFVYLMDHAYFIISDSGGVQEEAPSLGKPVLVTRNTTERPEAVEAGTVELVGTDTERIFSKSEKLLKDSVYYNQMSNVQNPYGDGRAYERIVEKLIHYYSHAVNNK